MPRISIVGTTASGKTTLARQVSERLTIPHIELDALFWEPNWTQAEVPVFQERVRAAVAGAAWVTDGNYKDVRPIVWERADTSVWLDYPLPLILSQSVRRTTRRLWTQEELWSGNRESLRGTLSRDSIVLWAVRTCWRNRRKYTALFAAPEAAHLQRIHLRSPRETARWLNSLPLEENAA